MAKKNTVLNPEPSKVKTTNIYNEKLLLSNKLFLLLVISAGFIVRLLYVVEIQSSPFIKNLFSDSKIYNDWALTILKSGSWFGTDVFFMSPFYPIVLSIIYSVFGQSVLTVLILQAIISSVLIIIVFYLAKILFDINTAKLAAILSALYGMFIFYSGLVLSETLMAFFISLAVLFIAASEKDNRKIIWFAAGLFTGISIVIRANVFIFLILFLIWLGIRIFKSKDKAKLVLAVYLLLGTAIPVLPLTLHNYMTGGDFVLLTSNGGINFYIGNNPNSKGVYSTPTEFDFNSDMTGKKYAEYVSGRELKPSEVSSFWYNKGFGFISGNLGSAVKLYLTKFFLLLGPNENPQASVMDYQFFKENFSQVLQLPLIPFSVVSYLSIIGFYFLWKERKKQILLILFVLAFLISSLLFFVNGRYRLPFTPVLIVIASYSVIQLYSFIKDNKWKELRNPLIIIALFILAYTFLVPKPTFSNYDAYSNLASIEYDEKNYDKAIEYYNKSLAFKDDYETYVSLGNSFAGKKDYRSALAAFQRAINRRPDFTLAYFDIGLAHTELKNYPMAIKAFAKVLELNPDFYDAYRNIAVAYYVQGDYEKALDNFTKYYPYVKDEKVRNSVLNDIQSLKDLLNKKQ